MVKLSLASKSLVSTGVFEAMEMYQELGWTDGLPIVPPTADRVVEFLEYAHFDGTEILGVEPTKGVVITTEKVAVNAVMAGCRPQYMPVVAAAVKAMCQEEFNLHAITVSTMGAAILLVVGGPIAKDLEMNSGVSVFGPGNRANATIGRAIRLVVMNILDTRPGGLDKGTLGHPGRYTWCIAEADYSLPWTALHEDRGVSKSANAVTVYAGLSPIQVGEDSASEPEGVLDAFRDSLFAMGPRMKELVVVLCPEHAEHIQRAGWSKRDVGRYLYEIARRPESEWGSKFQTIFSEGRSKISDEQGEPLISALASPDVADVIVAGADGGPWSMAIPTWSFGSRSMSVTHSIDL